MVLGKLTAPECNFVHGDQIWKDYVHKEAISARNWDSNWGFLKSEYVTMKQGMKKARSQKDTQPAKTPLKLPPLSPPKQDTSRPFPMRDSQLIGWRSGDRRCALEVYGRWGRPNWSIVKQLKWPNDAVP